MMAGGCWKSLGCRMPTVASFAVSCVLTKQSTNQMVHDESLCRFGKFGGKYVPQTLMHALSELESAFKALSTDIDFQLCGGKSSEGVFVGVLLSMSSTAVVLKFLIEKNNVNALHGQVTIGTLILQDCVVGLLFALLPVLGGTSGDRRRLLLRGLTESLPEILPLLYTLLERHFGAAMTEAGRQQIDIAKQHAATVTATLNAIKFRLGAKVHQNAAKLQMRLTPQLWRFTLFS